MAGCSTNTTTLEFVTSTLEKTMSLDDYTEGKTLVNNQYISLTRNQVEMIVNEINSYIDYHQADSLGKADSFLTLFEVSFETQELEKSLSIYYDSTTQHYFIGAYYGYGNSMAQVRIFSNIASGIIDEYLFLLDQVNVEE